jgi:hypothetical protein
MVIKLVYTLFLVALLSVQLLHAQGVEEQRKYVVNTNASLQNLTDSTTLLNGLLFHTHSKYTYFDVYMDTPELDLYKNNLSLRFRKRIFANGDTTYGMQLKSEMQSATSIRMEVEETELDLYKIKNNTSHVALIDVLNVFFFQLENGRIDANTTEIKNAIALLQAWVSFKADGCIVPFQKLLYLNLKGLELAKIKTLTPVIFGADTRMRGHVYINPTNTNSALSNMQLNAVQTSTTPLFFKTNKSYIWALETSLDSAVFYPLFNCNIPKVDINEYEVENKYNPKAVGTIIMNMLELGLKNKVETQLDSKYRQSIKKFNSNK